MVSLKENEPRVIFEDANFLAVYKPAGMLVHPIHAARSVKHGTKNNKKKNTAGYMLQDTGTLVGWLVGHYPETKNVGDSPEIRPGIVHRLDKDTSGIILIARNQKCFEYLKNLFQTRQIKKNYLALVWGEMKSKSGVIKKAIRLKPGTVKRTVWQGKMEKEAVTEYKVIKFVKLKTNEDKERIFSLLRVMPKTGRTHQIRVHLASIGHPVVGDNLYGKKENLGLKRLFLHAESLEFNLSEGKRMKIESELPDELRDFLRTLTNKWTIDSI